MRITYTYIFAYATILAAPIAACGPHIGDPCAVTEEQYPCHSAIVADVNTFGDTLGCTLIVVPDMQPCRTGVGVCEAGACVQPPAAPDSCLPLVNMLPAGAQDTCGSDADCDHTNPCRVSSCPNPVTDACRYDPVPNGTPCPGDMTCFNGSCCDDRIK